MIVDCFPFLNELDILEIRLEELKDVVDWFVLVEAGQTYSGKKKPFIYEENRTRFNSFNICHVKLNEFSPDLASPLHREAYTRNLLETGLDRLAVQPDDIVLLSDVDEIPRAAEVRAHAGEVAAGKLPCCVFEMTFSYYFVNYHTKDPWNGTRMARRRDIKTMHTLRGQGGEIIKSGGWHFSYVGGTDRIREKIGASIHTELDLPQFTDPANIERCRATGADLFGRNIHFWPVPLDDSYPRYLLDNQAKFGHLILIPPPSESAFASRTKKVLLDIGSGGKSSLGADWLGVDAYVPQADIIAEMWKLPFEDGGVDAIYSTHALEHVPMMKVMPTLEEWFRVLRPGGRLTLRVPDLAWCMVQWLNNPTAGFEMLRIFGNQSHEGEFHKCGFNEKLLASVLTTAGFEIQHIERIWSHEQQTLSAEAVKPAYRD